MSPARQRRSVGAIAAGILVVLLIAGPAGARPIRPNDAFTGRVNGKHARAIVHTACGGPGWTGRLGPVVGGQTVSVRRGGGGTGKTGVLSSVRAWFPGPDPTSPAPVQIVLTRYGTEVAIPTTIQVPCEGKGTVVFSSCPYLAPCAAGFVPDVVDVTFVNIAV